MTRLGESSGFCESIARALGEHAPELTAEWAAQVGDRLGLDAAPFIDPADPWIVRGIAAYLEGGAAGVALAVPLADRARRLGETGVERDILPDQILDAYVILYDMLLRTVRHALERHAGTAGVDETLPCLHRLHDATSLLVRATTSAYFDRYRERIDRDAERLHGFNRMVSHELKGPLSAIQGAAALLGDASTAADPGTRARYVEVVQRNTARMAELINDLLALTMVDRPEEGEAEVEPVALRDVLEAVGHRLADEAAERGVVLEWAAPDARLAVDGRALELVLVNLIRNGIRYSDPHKSHRRVVVGARRRAEENAWVVEVEDNGIGIPAEAGPRIFERFYRVRPEMLGTGLGLAIVKEVVERWGGRVWFESREGAGSEFFFTAPAPV